jgi:hypothetical protein
MSRLIITVMLFTFTTPPAFAVCLGCPIGGSGGGGTPAPGPIAGTGIAYDILVDMYFAARHWRDPQ